ncbi:hypothetical protein DFH06DRAFT_1149378 [Mycena polygramma]|nr:hypothetical protein DFH06DRAFT_1149378 [Mycena polygramma]
MFDEKTCLILSASLLFGHYLETADGALSMGKFFANGCRHPEDRELAMGGRRWCGRERQLEIEFPRFYTGVLNKGRRQFWLALDFSLNERWLNAKWMVRWMIRSPDSRGLCGEPEDPSTERWLDRSPARKNTEFSTPGSVGTCLPHESEQWDPESDRDSSARKTTEFTDLSTGMTVIPSLEVWLVFGRKSGLGFRDVRIAADKQGTGNPKDQGVAGARFFGNFWRCICSINCEEEGKKD